MESRDRTKIIRNLEQNLNYKRFIHTLGVAYTATSLAMRYGAEVEKAEMAGLLHDCAKCISTDKMMKICRNGNFVLHETEKNNPALLHSKAGRILAEQEYNVSDPDILSAIEWHTTGHPGMTLLEKIVFTADYIEPGRSSAKRLPQIRAMAFQDLDKAIEMILHDTLEYLAAAGTPIDEATRDTYNDFVRQIHEKERSE